MAFLYSISIKFMDQNLDFNENNIGYKKINVVPKFFKIIFSLILLAIISSCILYTYLKKEINTPLLMHAGSQQFLINKNESISEVASDLQKENLISDAFVFKVYAYLTGSSKHLKSGIFNISASMTPRQILHSLTFIPSQEEIITIREGWDISDIANYLQSNNIVSSEDFYAAEKRAAANFDYFGEQPQTKSLEGYLFPDTYFIAKNSNADEIIAKMLANTKEKITPQMVLDIHAQGRTVYQILTMASIVEREVGRNKSSLSQDDLDALKNERQIVSGIFYNRLTTGTPLQSDATVSFAKKILGLPNSIPNANVNSPYNTYKYNGLPPGPIANPSLSSIQAAIYPAKTDYFYFLSKPDGTAVFAKTLQEQDQNEKLYLGK